LNARAAAEQLEKLIVARRNGIQQQLKVELVTAIHPHQFEEAIGNKCVNLVEVHGSVLFFRDKGRHQIVLEIDDAVGLLLQLGQRKQAVIVLKRGFPLPARKYDSVEEVKLAILVPNEIRDSAPEA